MKFNKARFFIFFLTAILVTSNLWIIFSGKSYLYPALFHNFANIDDFKIFHNRTVKALTPSPIPASKHLKSENISPELEKLLVSLQSTALVVIKNDTLVFEKYWDEYDANALSNSFSVTKSIVCILTGIALKEKLIDNLDVPIGTIIKNFQNDPKGAIRIKDLLTMSSGLEWDESYMDPFSVTAEAYYGFGLWKLISRLKVKEKPGKQFYYKSCDTQILLFLLEAVTGKKVSVYVQEKLWGPLGAENSALWSLDNENGEEKGFCCFSATARDLARVGMLYLHKGNWKGKQLLDTAFVYKTLTPNCLNDKNGNSVNFYGMHWWLANDSINNFYYARGILGQYIICVPERNMVIVRLGKMRGLKRGEHPAEVYDLARGLY